MPDRPIVEGPIPDGAAPAGPASAAPIAAPARMPILRVVPGPADINTNGHIFGGWVLSQMDIAAGIVASRRAHGAVATVAIERMAFIAPVLLSDVISVYAEIDRVGRTSLAIRIEVIATRGRSMREVRVTEGLFTFVALDDAQRPRAVPPSTADD